MLGRVGPGRDLLASVGHRQRLVGRFRSDRGDVDGRGDYRRRDASVRIERPRLRVTLRLPDVEILIIFEIGPDPLGIGDRFRDGEDDAAVILLGRKPGRGDGIAILERRGPGLRADRDRRRGLVVDEGRIVGLLVRHDRGAGRRRADPARLGRPGLDRPGVGRGGALAQRIGVGTARQGRLLVAHMRGEIILVAVALAVGIGLAVDDVLRDPDLVEADVGGVGQPGRDMAGLDEAGRARSGGRPGPILEGRGHSVRAGRGRDPVVRRVSVGRRRDARRAQPVRRRRGHREVEQAGPGDERATALEQEREAARAGHPGEPDPGAEGGVGEGEPGPVDLLYLGDVGAAADGRAEAGADRPEGRDRPVGGRIGIDGGAGAGAAIGERRRGPGRHLLVADMVGARLVGHRPAAEMDVDLEIRAGARLRSVEAEHALGDHDVPIVGEVAERVGMAGNGGGQGPREAHPRIALAADGEVALLVDEAPGAKVHPARRRHELLRRSVDQLVHRRGRRGEPEKEEGESERETRQPEAG